MKLKREIPPRVTKDLKRQTPFTIESAVTNSFKKKSRGIVKPPKSAVLDKAEEIQSGLNPNYPSFIKQLLRSHVSGSFWLKLPKAFCTPNLPRKNILLTLLDEQGDEYTVKCVAPRFALSAGWSRFATAHKLVEGDALVFHLVEAYKFKVYVVRACGLADADLPCDLPSSDIPPQGSLRGATGRKITKKSTGNLTYHSGQHMVIPSTCGEVNATYGTPAEKHMESHPSIPFLKTKLEQHDEHTSAVETEFFMSLDSFKIVVDGMLIDTEISEDVRTKYHELCCSQKSYLHKHLVEGLNRRIIAEIISEIVNIVDAIRSSSKLSTPKDKFKAWEKSLKSCKHMGMNVDFLLARVTILLQQSSAFDYNAAVIEENRLEEEIAARRVKILELRNDWVRLERQLRNLKSNREKHESAFQSIVNSPW
ncbi:B3 domain-containing protein Os01g0234100-like isoform X1 [Papaver somniferum]|uniref:B3 domain-containing protein Os01g0234100-like isoform X1 n=1 Tax=Papaver somniferum TaxID=3469 RepID=UPI000E6FC0DE|nr:B3 domain-containing protein Os01g0234100-like isoform X1 [Papaver somniferum]